MPEDRNNAGPLKQDLEQMAYDTFATKDDASKWLRRSHPMLDDLSPLELSRTEAGAQRVIDMLMAIKYGGVL